MRRTGAPAAAPDDVRWPRRLRPGRFRPRLGRIPAVLTLAGLATLASWGHAAAQEGRREVREGNRLYSEGRFDEAHETYLEALRAAPGSPVVLFDDGNALYRQDDFQGAAEAYRGALEGEDPGMASAAWYNLGNALYRAQQLPLSLEAYKQALRIDPNATDAKHNLERVLEQLQAQQQDQGGQQGQEDQNQGQQEGQQDQDQNQGQQDQQQDRQDPGDPRSDPSTGPQGESGQQPPDPSPEEGEGVPRPGEMTRQEAERLLGSLTEDPGDVNRRPPVPATGPRPRKAW